MKKAACAVLIFTMVIFLINPVSSYAGGYYGGGGHWGGGYNVYRGGGYGGGHNAYRGGHGGGYGPWWVPLAIVGGAVALVANSVAVLSNAVAGPPNYYSPNYAPYYAGPPVYVQPVPPAPPRGVVYVYPR